MGNELPALWPEEASIARRRTDAATTLAVLRATTKVATKNKQVL
ncbi:MAG: hypothetical protein ACI9QQ_003096 [Myxococcota bacterium]|jgi:hypothetical protein